MLDFEPRVLIICRSMAEAQVADAAIERFRKADSGIVPTSENVAERIYNGLTFAALPRPYRELLSIWHKADPSEFVPLPILLDRLGISIGQARAFISKLSRRMKRIAEPSEISNLRTPLLLLVDIAYDDSRSSSHRLTSAGRVAVRRYLKAV